MRRLVTPGARGSAGARLLAGHLVGPRQAGAVHHLARGLVEQAGRAGGIARALPLLGEVFWVLAGDVFVLPKGWSGRWDITETVRKFAVLVG